MDNYNIFGGSVTLEATTIGGWIANKIGEQGSNLISGLLTAGFGFGMIVFLIAGIQTLIEMGKETNVQKKQMQKKRATNAFIIAIGFAIATGTIGVLFLAIPIDFGDLSAANTVFNTALPDYTSFGSYVHLPLIIS